VNLASHQQSSVHISRTGGVATPCELKLLVGERKGKEGRGKGKKERGRRDRIKHFLYKLCGYGVAYLVKLKHTKMVPFLSHPVYKFCGYGVAGAPPSIARWRSITITRCRPPLRN